MFELAAVDGLKIRRYGVCKKFKFEHNTKVSPNLDSIISCTQGLYNKSAIQKKRKEKAAMIARIHVNEFVCL